MANPKGQNTTSFCPIDSQNLRFETLVIADYEYVKISNFTWSNITLLAFKVGKVEKSKALIYKDLTVI